MAIFCSTEPDPGQEVRLGHDLSDSELIGMTGEHAPTPFLLDPIDVPSDNSAVSDCVD